MPSWQRALLVVGLLAVFFGLIRWLGIALPVFLVLGIVLAVVVVGLPWVGVRWLDALEQSARDWAWRREAGRHHAFGNVALAIQDDGRHLWIVGSDLQRVLRTEDAEDVLAARTPGRWRRDADDRLWLRVDAVVERLATAPGRMEPRTVRLRRYLERDVLFPAAERRRRAR